MVSILVVCAMISGIIYIFSPESDVGRKFLEGFKALGGLAVSIIGLYSLAPIAAALLVPVLGPVGEFLHVDPSFFISALLAPDMGGYNAAMDLGGNAKLALFNAVVLTSTLGTVISFTFPVGSGLIEKKDMDYFLKGILAGIVTIPVGMVVAALMLKLTLTEALQGILPTAVISILIILGLKRRPTMVIKIFSGLGKVISALSIFGLLALIGQDFLGYPNIWGMPPMEESATIILRIAVILAGAYPLIYFISTRFSRPLQRLGGRFDLDAFAVLGLLTSLINCVPMFGIMKDMDRKGKMVNAAFSVSAAYVFGGQLGYISAVEPDMVPIFTVSKLVAGVAAVFVASLMARRETVEEDSI